METKESWFAPINQPEFWGDKVIRQLSKMIETYYDEVFEFWVPGVCLTGSSSTCKNRLEPYIKHFEIYIFSIFQASLCSVLLGIFYQQWFSQGEQNVFVSSSSIHFKVLKRENMKNENVFTWFSLYNEQQSIIMKLCIYPRLHGYEIWSHQGVDTSYVKYSCQEGRVGNK